MKAIYNQLRKIKAQAAGAVALTEVQGRDPGEVVELLADLAEAMEEELEKVMVQVGDKLQ